MHNFCITILNNLPFVCTEPVDKSSVFYAPNYNKDNEYTVRAKFLWSKLTTAFILTENCRFDRILDSLLAQFAEGARVSNPDMKLIDKINLLCLVDSQEHLQQRLAERDLLHNSTCLPSEVLDKRKVVILAATHEVVNEINSKVCIFLINSNLLSSNNK